MLDKLHSSSKIVEKALDATWLRNETVSQNLANVDTPGYKRKEVSFEEYLSGAINERGIRGRRTNRRHIPIGKRNVDDIDIKVRQDNKNLSVRLDGNNVDIDNEMAAMAKNTIQYNTLVQRMGGHFRRLKSVISEGRR